MIRYLDFKKQLIDSYQLSSEKEIVTKQLAVLENNMFIDPVKIADALSMLYWNMSVSYEKIFTLIQYFWSSNIAKAKYIFEKRKTESNKMKRNWVSSDGTIFEKEKNSDNYKVFSNNDAYELMMKVRKELQKNKKTQ